MKLRATVIFLLVAMLAMGWLAFSTRDTTPQTDGEVAAYVRVRLDGADQTVKMIQRPDGQYYFHLADADGGEALTPDQFARRVHVEQERRSWWHALLNISTPLGILWVSIGLLGQVLFTGRMIVQWLASEKQHESVVPVSFWWMSLIGATMLLTYFIWRKDIVGVLGQAAGWLIYVRNLYLIYFTGEAASKGRDPGPEPELAE